jgi:hypothetical protein
MPNDRIQLLQGTLDMLILTPAGKQQLVAEESKWKKLTGAVAWPPIPAVHSPSPAAASLRN